MARPWSETLETSDRQAVPRRLTAPEQPGGLRDTLHSYREPLQRDPDHPDALHHAGMLALQGGRPVEALELVNRALARLPGFAEAHNTRGSLLRARGRPDDAIGCYRQAIMLAPADPLPWNNLGNALHELGRADEALRAYQEAIARMPAVAEAHLNRGIVLTEQGQHQEALAAFASAVRIRPDFGLAHAAYGKALRGAGRLDEAIENLRRAVSLDGELTAAYCELGFALSDVGRYLDAADALQAALALDPVRPEAHNGMGNVCKSLGYLDQALSAYRQALAERPDYVDAHFNLGVLLADLHRPVEALASFRAALTFRPDHVKALAHMGAAQLYLGRAAEAIAAFRRALALDPGLGLTWYQLGRALQQQGQSSEAARAYERAVAITPGDAETHWRRALALLAAGDYRDAWTEYQWRWRVPEYQFESRSFAVPEWRGESLHGRRILVHADEGPSDTLLFARYLPMVAQRGGRIVLECDAELIGLLEALPAVDLVVARGDRLPTVDCHVGLESLPGVVGTLETTVPMDIPYLNSRSWSGRIPSLPAGRGLKVGLAWSAAAPAGTEPALTLGDLVPLLEQPGIAWFSLETAVARADLALVPEARGVHDLAPLIRGWPDAAGLASQLDLLITVEGTLAHLAGGLGIPVWLLQGGGTDWRWSTERGESLWYPTARVIQRPRGCDWSMVVAEVGRLLAGVAGNPGAR